MKLTKIILRKMTMRMKNPFTTSFGTVQDKKFIIVEVYDEQGFVGYGECDAFEAPWYTEETVETCWYMLQQFFIPALLKQELNHPSDVRRLLMVYRRNAMAKAAIETAIWDVYAKKQNKPLYQVIGGTQSTIDIGVSIGLQTTTAALYEKIDQALLAGYKRVKVKIKPGQDIAVIRSIRSRYKELPLMVDANSAYTLDDLELLQSLDEFNLLMIEQPLAADDIVQHATLQAQLKTPICLDESICSLKDAMTAIELQACKIFNIKIARVGGMEEARLIHHAAQQAGMKVWCGGMLEAGIGRAHSIALASLPYFSLPGDTAASSHYFAEDIISPEVMVDQGVIHLSQRPGIGYDVNQDAYEYFTIDKQLFE
ncbi:o-succinylbenzoate synthase [Kurthia sibirica]|uniref:o-succinylbenzoate synthase n=1 Tax=Kurthia sibirica TaxID=202750 RepID=A0A2U3AK83_9BACL|nr:o-succinylbenzoate synthase [Kurthia sibirica]PWI24935.1 o-succinylbenzoate synthase [Kurthia sibirica]GEK33154.1 o-succinylbenzoate synthase [Kurthia sibirica]